MGSIDAYTKLLLPFDGIDESQVFTDISPSEHGNAIVGGTAQVDTAQRVFGSGALLLDGNSDYLQYIDSADWYYGTSAFTIDFRVRFAALPTSGNLMTICGQRTAGVDYSQLALRNTAGAYTWEYVAGVSSVETITVAKTTTIAINTWYHIALIRTGDDFKFFQAGTQVGSTTTDSSEVPDIAAVLWIGQWNGGQYLNGWIDELRVSKGIARWTANFTPPNRAYGYAAGGFSGTHTSNWMFMKDMWEKHNKLWTPKGILIPEGI